MSDGSKGMFFHGMWSTEPLTFWQRRLLSGRMTRYPLVGEIACIVLGFMGGAAIFCTLLMEWVVPAHSFPLYRLIASCAMFTVWAVVWFNLPDIPDRSKSCYDMLTMQGTLLPADHPVVRMLQPVVFGVWRANTSRKGEISQIINEFAGRWRQYTRQHGANWYLKPEHQDEWLVLIAAGESDLIGRLGRLCPPSNRITGWIQTVFCDDAKRESCVVEERIASCEHSLASLNEQVLTTGESLQAFRQQQAFLLEVNPHCPQP